MVGRHASCTHDVSTYCRLQVPHHSYSCMRAYGRHWLETLVNVITTFSLQPIGRRESRPHSEAMNYYAVVYTFLHPFRIYYWSQTVGWHRAGANHKQLGRHALRLLIYSTYRGSVTPALFANWLVCVQ